MNYLEIITIIVLGWLAGAESGSWMCVHPVISKLPPNEQIIFQKGLLKTFGRIMPVLMPLSLVLVISLYMSNADKTSLQGMLQLIGVIILATAIITTIFFNVPINLSTANWSSQDYSVEWKKKRKVWRFFQGYRSIIFFIVFGMLITASHL